MSAAITQERMSDEFTKYHLTGPWPNYPLIHHFSGPDRGGPHDHPWPFRVTVLSGGYVERIYEPDLSGWKDVIRGEGDCFAVPAERIHSITRLLVPDCWTFVYRLNPGEPDKPWRHYDEAVQSFDQIHDAK